MDEARVKLGQHTVQVVHHLSRSIVEQEFSLAKSKRREDGLWVVLPCVGFLQQDKSSASLDDLGRIRNLSKQ